MSIVFEVETKLIWFLVFTVLQHSNNMDRIVGTIRVLSSDTKVFKTPRKSMYYYNRNGNKSG